MTARLGGVKRTHGVRRDRTRLGRVFDSETLGLAAFVTSAQLPLSLQLSLQPPARVHHVPHLPLPVHPETFDLLSQVTLGFDGLAETTFLRHLHKFQFLRKTSALVGTFPPLSSRSVRPGVGVPAEGCVSPARPPPASPPASPSS